jgi:hypothetical protein
MKGKKLRATLAYPTLFEPEPEGGFTVTFPKAGIPLAAGKRRHLGDKGNVARFGRAAPPACPVLSLPCRRGRTPRRAPAGG